MPRYRFSWDAFDNHTVQLLAESWGYDEASACQNHRRWLAEVVKRPTDEFVYATKRVLEDTWLTQHPNSARAIVERLLVEGIGPRTRPSSEAGYVDFLRKCRNTKTIRRLLCEALIKHGDLDRVTDDESIDPLGTLVPRFAVIRPEIQQRDDRRPHRYQEIAWERLKAHLVESQMNGVFEGLLVMPTGSGKTYTAARWLMEQHVNRGGRVLWLAHRYELLEQAAHAFHRAAHVVLRHPLLRIRIVSGPHCTVTQICPDDNIVVCSLQSLSRRPDVAEQLLSDPHLFLVVDEAHHTPAKSYRKLLQLLRQREQRRVLGLTATPTRTLEGERPLLAELFGGRKIHEVRTRDLIEQRFLARPHPVHVKTHSAVEEGVTTSDIRHLNQFNELSEAWKIRIAQMVERNEQIVRHYLEHRERYGKTLVFAINVLHADLLCQRFQEEGIETEYVTSYRPDGQEVNNKETIDRFREPLSGLDVLINVEILTEGVDLPSIQTVFLTRPTTSEILLRQMIGRSLRGPKMGGTERAYIVSFEDHWNEFTEWEHPFDLVSDIFEGLPELEEPAVPAPKALVDALPWDLIRAAVEAMRRVGNYQNVVDAFDAVPHGWYVLEREEDGEPVRQIIPVYEHQKSCWEALLRHLVQAAAEDMATADPEALYDEFFYDCDAPQPSHHHVGETVEHIRDGGELPEYHSFEARKQADPYEIANEIVEQNLSRAEQSDLIRNRYELQLVKAIYSSLREFDAAVADALFEKEHPDQATKPVRAVVVFEPLSDRRLTPGPAHDLQKLLQETMQKAAEVLDVPSLSYTGPIEWTRREIRGWYAQARWEPGQPFGTGLIRVNRRLDSPDVSADTLRFLLWHEFLHLYLQEGHTPQFRELERRWPGVINADNFLDTMHERFDIQSY